MNIKYAVIIPARNEERYIGISILSLKKQTIKPYVIIVVDDSSNDKTPEIAERSGAIVIRIKRKSKAPATGTPYLAYVINKGLERIKKLELDYAMISGADTIYPKDYVYKIISRMINENVVLASGVAYGEYSSSLSIRGSGRVINAKWFKKIGFKYPENYGFETWLVFKALSQGLRVKVYKDLKFFSFRKTSFNARKAYFYGKAMKALGYSYIYVIARFLYATARYSASKSKYLILGYLKSNVRKYSDILYYTKYIQAKNLLYRLFKGT